VTARDTGIKRTAIPMKFTGAEHQRITQQLDGVTDDFSSWSSFEDGRLFGERILVFLRVLIAGTAMTTKSVCRRRRRAALIAD
jgi:hypothetical protein